jgi:hypothetical protein
MSDLGNGWRPYRAGDLDDTEDTRRDRQLAAEVRMLRESNDLKFERLFTLIERQTLAIEDINQRLDAYLTRTLETEKRVDGLEAKRPRRAGKK